MEAWHLEGRELFAVAIHPLAGEFAAGTAGFQVEFRQADVNMQNDVREVDALFALPPDSPSLLSQAFDDGVGLIHYLDRGVIDFLSLLPRDVGSQTLAQTTKGAFRDQAGDDQLAMVARGILFIPRAGVWNLTVGSDDGFRLVMGTNDAVVARFDGTRGYATTTGQADVATPGFYPFELTWYQGDGPAGCAFYANGPGQPDAHLVGDVNGTLKVAQIIAAAPRAIHTSAGAPVGINFTFADANRNAAAEPFLATLDWGDGTSSEVSVPRSGPDGTFVIEATHVYASAGDFTFRATVRHRDGRGVTTTGQAMVAPPVVTMPSPPPSTQPSPADPPTGTVSNPPSLPVPSPVPLPAATAPGPAPSPDMRVSGVAVQPLESTPTDLSNPQVAILLTAGAAPAGDSAGPPPTNPRPSLSTASGDQRSDVLATPVGKSQDRTAAFSSGAGENSGEPSVAVPPVAEAPALWQPTRWVDRDEPAEQRRNDHRLVTPSPLTTREGIALSEAVFLAASSSTVDADCAFGEPIPLLPTETAEVQIRYPGPMDNESVVLPLLWFVMTAFLALNEEGC
jgi:hypothetical protein